MSVRVDGGLARLKLDVEQNHVCLVQKTKPTSIFRPVRTYEWDSGMNRAIDILALRWCERSSQQWTLCSQTPAVYGDSGIIICFFV